MDVSIGNELARARFELNKAEARLQLIPVLEGQIQSLESEIARLRDETCRQAAELESVRAKRAQTSLRFEQSAAANQSLQNELRHLTDQLEKSRSQLRVAQDSQKKREEELRSIQALEVEQLKKESATQLHGYAAAVQQHVQALLAQKESETAEKLAARDRRILELEVTLEAQQQETKRSLESFMRRAREYSSLERSLAETRQSLSQACSELAAAGLENSRLQGILAQLQRQNSRLRGEVFQTQGVLNDMFEPSVRNDPRPI